MNKINEQLMQLINWLTWDLAKRIREQVLDEKKRGWKWGGGGEGGGGNTLPI